LERATLVKFGRPEHIQALQKGLMYFNKLEYYLECEDGPPRADPPRAAEVVVPDRPGVAGWDFRVQAPDAQAVNLFCMCALRPGCGSFPVDERNLALGEAALVLREPQQFIDRAREALRRARISARAGLVTYVGESYSGELGPLRKRAPHAHQSEWRIVCYHGPGCGFSLEIGDITDITLVVQSAELNSILSAGTGVLSATSGEREQEA
jgi:hypothetical protein